ncbi:CvpA family protein [uncultured Sulfurimonas sp.]|jgi:membrane protein required for colicin V production|uniref:CvpA family protein n=1 Tax=uncultured Sulfurimonas sp. TaxID=291845 RepID=UPI0032B297C3
MEINYFDIIAASIILLLGLKGILNGFFKEVFGLIGIIGGIFIASRVGESVGEYLNTLIFNFASPSAVNFLGFITTLSGFWILMVILGAIFKKLSSLSGLGIFDRILGFIFGASKFFLIASVIAHAAFNVQSVKSSMESFMQTSFLFPVMVEAGAFIMKMDPVLISDDINSTIDKIEEEIKTTTEDVTQEIIIEHVDAIKDAVTEKVTEKVKETVKEQVE